MPEQFLSFRSLMRYMPLILLVILASILLVGCTSDLPDDMGMGLVETQFEVELEPMEIFQTNMYSSLVINDAGVPYDEQEVLYLGRQGGNESSILANFTFDDLFTDEFVDTMFTDEHITSVNLLLLVLNDYQSLIDDPIVDEEDESKQGLIKDFLVYQLEAPFDSLAYPGPEPAHELDILNDGGDNGLGTTFRISLPIFTAYFLDWMEEGGSKGLIITEGNSTEEGLVGYTSRDMQHGGSNLVPVEEDTYLGVSLQVNFDDNSSLVIECDGDISTFHQISEAPADIGDGFMLRTVLRSYPMFRFDYSTLPDNIFINRAILQVANDTLSSFGHPEAMMTGEIDSVFFSALYDTMGLTELSDITTNFTGMGLTGFEPLHSTYAQFNVTTSVQRIVNNAYEGERGFILTGSEYFTAAYYPNEYFLIPPDIYFVQLLFHGINADEDLRPKLIIHYSTVEELLEGGAQ